MPGVTTAYQTGVHGSRPAATSGCILYSCTTHGLVYRSDGTSWATWLTLPSGSSAATPALTFGTSAAAGSSGTFINSDATLPIFDATVPSTQAFSDAAAAGAAGVAARRDHKHGMPASPGGGGGSEVWLNGVDASASATIDFAGFISGTYKSYRFRFTDIIPATNAAQLWMRMGTGGTPTYDAGANYHYHQWRYFASSQGPTGGDGQSAIILCLGIGTGSANYSVSGEATLFNAAGAIHKTVQSRTTEVDTGAGAYLGTFTDGIYQSTTAITAVRFLMSSGNIASGRIDMYGIKAA